MIGDTSISKLTLPEARVLLEGVNQANKREARQSGHTRGSGPHERAPGEHRESDEQWVQELADDS